MYVQAQSTVCGFVIDFFIPGLRRIAGLRRDDSCFFIDVAGRVGVRVVAGGCGAFRGSGLSAGRPCGN